MEGSDPAEHTLLGERQKGCLVGQGHREFLVETNERFHPLGSGLPGRPFS